MEDDLIEFRKIEISDLPEVVQHLSNHFSRGESTLQLFPCDDDIISDLTWILKIILADELSILGQISSTGEIIGVLCPYIQPRNEERLPFSLLKSKALQVAFGLTSVSVENSNFWNIIQAEDYIHIFALSIHPIWRGQGLATKLSKSAVLVGKGYVTASLFTSPFSRRIATGLGFIEMENSRIKYVTLTRNGLSVFDDVEEAKDKIGVIMWLDQRKCGM